MGCVEAKHKSLPRACPFSKPRGHRLNGELDLYNDWRAKGLQRFYARGELAVEPNPASGPHAWGARSRPTPPHADTALQTH